MRIKIIGENDTAKALRTLLRKAGFAVCEFLPAEAVTQAPVAGYVITIEESGQSGWIHLDSVDSELEGAVLRHITQLSPHAVSVDRPGGQIHSERELRIVVPAGSPAGDAAQAQAVEYGVLRGLLEILGPKPLKLPEPPAPAKPSWWKRFLGVLALALMCAAGLCAAPATAGREVVLVATDDAGGVLLLRVPANIFAQLQQPGSGSNVNLSQIGGASVASALYDSANTAMKVNCVVGCSATGSFTDNAIFTTGASSVTNISGLFNDAAANLASGNAGAIRATTDRMLFVNIGKINGTAPTLTGSSLNVNCTGGCGGAASFADSAVFTAGTTAINVSGGVFNDGLAAVASGNAAAPRITAQRGVHVNLRNNSGTETGTATAPLRVDPTGTTTQPVSGTVTANAGTGSFTVGQATGTNLHMVCDSGCTAGSLFTDNTAFTAGTTSESNIGGVFNDGLAAVTSGNAAAARITGSRALHTNLRNNSGTELASATAAPAGTELGLIVRNIPSGTQPVSGSVTTTPPANASANVAQFGGSAVVTGTGVSGAGIPRVTLSNDSSLAANQSVNVAQVGGTATVTGGVSGTLGVGGTTAAGSAAAGNPEQIAGNASGNVTRVVICDNFKAVNISTATTTVVIALVASKTTYICGWHLFSAGADNVALVFGTGASCATGITGVAGGTTAATGYNFTAQTGVVVQLPMGSPVRQTTVAADTCIITSAAVQLSGMISYTQF
jgi:hypothetical protein